MRYLRIVACFTAAIAFSGLSHAATINYGNSPVIPPGVTFSDVTESSGTDAVPLYGAPAYFNTGIDFDPTSFVASAVNGAADITDGQLNFTLTGDTSGPGLTAINSLSLFEAGDYSLVGTGTSATEVFAGAIIQVTVTEIDGVAVAPINLVPVSISVDFDLAADSGLVQPWSLNTSINIAAQLTTLGHSFVAGATQIEVAINDTLIAISEAGSVAFIAKKNFTVNVNASTQVVPEPASLALLASGGLLIAWRRRAA